MSVNPDADNILLSALSLAEQYGLNETLITRAVADLGLDPMMGKACFPNGIEDVLIAFADWADRQMLEQLKQSEKPDRVRDQVRHAVWTRLMVLEPYRPALKLSVRYWARPDRSPSAMQTIWRTADRIWDYAGDQATDYNRYTKRGLLSGVLATTTLSFIKDESAEYEKTDAFLNRKIDGVVWVGRKTGPVLSKLAGLGARFSNRG